MDLIERDLLADAASSGPHLIVLKRAAEERVAGLASDLELILALRSKVRAGRAMASSSRAVQKASDRIPKDQVEALGSMTC